MSDLSPEQRQLKLDIARLRAAIHCDSSLTGTDHRVADAMLTKYVNNQVGRPKFGLMWPSVGEIARVSDSKERSVRRSLSRLRARGYLVVRTAGGGVVRGTSRERGQSTTYALGSAAVRNPANSGLETLPIEVRNPANSGLETLPILAPNSLGVTLKEERGARAHEDDFRLEENEKQPPEPWQSSSLDEWQPGPEMAGWAASHVPSVADPVSAEKIDDFKDHYRSTGHMTSHDWNARYRRWLRREVVRDHKQLEMMHVIPGSVDAEARSPVQATPAERRAFYKQTGFWPNGWGRGPDAEGAVA